MREVGFQQRYICADPAHLGVRGQHRKARGVTVNREHPRVLGDGHRVAAHAATEVSDIVHSSEASSDVARHQLVASLLGCFAVAEQPVGIFELCGGGAPPERERDRRTRLLWGVRAAQTAQSSQFAPCREQGGGLGSGSRASGASKPGDIGCVHGPVIARGGSSAPAGR